MFSVMIFVILSVFCSCGSTKAAENQDIEKFPFLSLNNSSGYVYSYFDADIVNNPLSTEGKKIFNDNIVYSFNSAYKLYDNEYTADYYVIIFDFIRTVAETDDIKHGDIIGRTGKEAPKILVFCETIDPYLVISCNSVPHYYGGFYWFDGSFLFSSGKATKWLDYDPTENIEKKLIDVADHATEEPGMVFYPQFSLRFQTRLEEYPREITDGERQEISAYENMLYGRNDVTTHVNEIQAGKYKYLLCWQRGFDQYLKKEYILNNDIWVFGKIATYSAWRDCGYLFIRDFTLESLETMYENRISIISEKK